METPRPPATAEFGAVSPGGPAHVYPDADGARVTKLSVGGFDNNVYIVRSLATGQALLIDASAPTDRILGEIQDLKIVAIAITHNHPDHTAGLRQLVGELKAPVLAHPDDAARIPVETDPLRDGETLHVGDLRIEVIHTPGHTPGSTCLLVGSHLFSGDTLFPGGPGNTTGGGFARIMSSLEERIFALPDESHVSPGHGIDTRIGLERPHLPTWRTRGW